jgi:uncharacterized protein YndB with AHSA1/START domain
MPETADVEHGSYTGQFAIYKPAKSGRGGVLRFELNPRTRAVFVEGARQAPGEIRRFVWQKKIVMKWGLSDVGESLAVIERRQPLAKLFHKTQKGSTAFELKYQGEREPANYFATLSRQDAETKEVEKLGVALSPGEAATLACLLRYAVVALVGWGKPVARGQSMPADGTAAVRGGLAGAPQPPAPRRDDSKPSQARPPRKHDLRAEPANGMAARQTGAPQRAAPTRAGVRSAPQKTLPDRAGVRSAPQKSAPNRVGGRSAPRQSATDRAGIEQSPFAGSAAAGQQRPRPEAVRPVEGTGGRAGAPGRQGEYLRGRSGELSGRETSMRGVKYGKDRT